jgi:hypothetical protein
METTARQWREAALALREHAQKFERTAEKLEADEAVVVEVTPEAEELIRSQGKTMHIGTNDSGLQLDMLERPDA